MSDRISRTEWLDRTFLDRLLELLEALRTESIPLEVFETARSPLRQDLLYNRGRDPTGPDYGRTVTRARAYESPHQFGLAADLVFKVGGAWTWQEPSKGMWKRMGELANGLGLQTLSFEKPHVQAAAFAPTLIQHGPMDTAGWMRWLGDRNGPGPTS
jgi:peptidoglycan LD-endopeptidase CwlK